MTRLPETVDFDATAFPELSDIFAGVDAAIAAIVASDPAFRPKPAHKRRTGKSSKPAGGKLRSARVQRAAA